jgi:hypothetical protein
MCGVEPYGLTLTYSHATEDEDRGMILHLMKCIPLETMGDEDDLNRDHANQIGGSRLVSMHHTPRYRMCCSNETG